jgi:hypothetical protein
MDKKTLTALNGSIKHWKDNVKLAKAGCEININSDNCHLCNSFGYNCENCPVFIKTRRTICSGTPYHNVADLVTSCITGKRLINACEAELKFLKSLLPKKIKTLHYCRFCGTKSVIAPKVSDPYESDLHGDTTRYFICVGCLKNRSDEL